MSLVETGTQILHLLVTTRSVEDKQLSGTYMQENIHLLKLSKGNKSADQKI